MSLLNKGGSNILIIALFLFNIIIRFWGILFPHRTYDELQYYRGANALAEVFVGQSSIEKFNDFLSINGPLTKYLAFISYSIGKIIPANHMEPSASWVYNRFLIGLIPSLLTILIVLLTLKKKQGKSDQIVCLILFMGAYTHIESAHYAVSDSLVTLIVSFTLFAQVMHQQTRKKYFLLFSVLFAALATATKLPVGFCLLFAILLDVYLRNSLTLRFTFQAFGLFFISVSILHIPYIIYIEEWIILVKYHLDGYPFRFDASLITYFFFKPFMGLGFLLFIASSLAMYWQVKNKIHLFSFIFTAAYIGYLALATGQIQRWVLPLTPVLIFALSNTITELRSKNELLYRTAFICLIIIVIPNFFNSILFARNMAQEPTFYSRVLNYLDNQGIRKEEVSFISSGFKNKGGFYRDTTTVQYALIDDIPLPNKTLPIYLNSEIGWEKYVLKKERTEEKILSNWDQVQKFENSYYKTWSDNVSNPPGMILYKKP